MSRRGRDRLASVGLAVVALGVSVGVLELVFRSMRFDFDFQRRAFERLPIFFRQPIVPLPNGLFRRPGPVRWEGRVLTSMLRRRGVPEAYIPDEAPITVTYDAQGFRNPAGLDDWVVVVAGDSFTELGHLPDEELFTTRLAERLGVAVKNLGVSWTGPFSQSTYLELYGWAPSARHAVLAFFEGNDLDDAFREARMLEAARWRRSRGLGSQPAGTRLDQIQPQSSFVRAIFRLVRRLRWPAPRELPNAWFETDAGAVPVGIFYVPLDPATLPQAARAPLEQALREWSGAARRHGMRPWLIYLPSKHRVLREHLRFAPEAEDRIVAWQPNALPDFVRRLAEAQRITFLDATPALQAEAAAGHLTYVALGDSHLNALGAKVVAGVLADAIGEADASR